MLLNDEELESVSGGRSGRAGFYLTVVNCKGSYLALRDNEWDWGREVAKLYPGYRVFTYGEIKNGLRYVNYDYIWGWADASYLICLDNPDN